MLVDVPGQWKLAAEYYFPLAPQPWMRVNDQKRKPEKMRSYQNTVAELAREQEQPKVLSRCFMVVHYFVHASKGDQTNNAKCIEDALNRIAYHDDKQNRQVLILETLIDKKTQEHTTVQIYEEKPNE